MRFAALFLCLMLGVILALMPRAALARDELAMGAVHGAMSMQMPAGQPCKTCPEGTSNSAARHCPAMGVLCNSGADCGASVSSLSPGFALTVRLRSLALRRPPLPRVVAQRALVPEPPPPRA